jgi:hypothetical protein
LVLVAPNEFFTPGTPPGYSGSVVAALAGYPVTITIRALNLSTYQLLAVNDTLILTSSATADQIRDLPAQVNLVNGAATVSARFMQPGTTYTITASPRTFTFIQNGTTRPIPCNAGPHALNPILEMNHTSLAPVTAVQGEQQLAMLALHMINPNGAGSAAYDVRGVTLTVQNREQQTLSGQDLLTSVSLWDATGNVLLAKVAAGTGSQVYVPIPQHAFLIYPGESRDLRVVADLNPASLVRELRLGVMSDTDVDAAFLDDTVILVSALAPDAFAMFSDTVTVQVRDLKASYINYPNPFGAGTQTTRIEYFLEQDAVVSLKIYSITGQPVRALVDGAAQTGGQSLYRYDWDGRNGRGQVVLNGVYFAVLSVKPASGGSAQTLILKIAVIK